MKMACPLCDVGTSGFSDLYYWFNLIWGKGAQEFYNVLTLMTNVAMTLPYLFLSGAFPYFKKANGTRPFFCDF